MAAANFGGLLQLLSRFSPGGMPKEEANMNNRASSATISRVNRSLLGGTGTYDKVFAQLEEDV